MGRMKKLFREAVRTLYFVRNRLAGTGSPSETGGEYWRSLWSETAEAVGAELVDLGAGFFELRRGGKATRVCRSFVEIDHPVTLQLAGNKAVVNGLLSAEGIPTPKFAAYDLNRIDRAVEFARELGRELDKDCVVKPMRGTGSGEGVTTHVRTRRQITHASYHASLFCRELIIEEQIEGDVYRLLYLDGEFVDAVRRRPPRVVGDGKSSIRQLIEAENRRRTEQGGAAAIGTIRMDVDCKAAVARAGHTLGSVVPHGEEVVVKGISNAGAELESESVSDEICDALREEGARAAKVVRVDLAGVDVITPDPSTSLSACGGVVNEVNTTPGLQWHYRIRNPEQGVKVAIRIVERILG